MAGADMIVGVDINPAREKLARELGLTHFVNPAELKGGPVGQLVEVSRGGADYRLEGGGNVTPMRQAPETCSRVVGAATLMGG
jgi:S-(hydroxymethyl)glutathione dehydrogenase/alcohol dehydrogenase